VSLVSAAIKLLTKHPDVTPVNITEERPQFKKRRDAGGRRRFDGEGHRGEKRRRFESGGKTKKHDRRKKEDHFSGRKTKKHDGDKKGNIHESSFKPYFKEL
ncbi:MAG: DEAD/DEAH box helicase, partial [Dialister sp.]|nr:DEAD/DEAH box helicase [Dialister sp.]